MSDAIELAERKRRWRVELRDRLAAIPPERARAGAERIADRVLALPELAAARHVLACLSFGAELDTWGLIERLGADGRRLYVPRADPRDGRLHVHPFPCPLETLGFGLRQPPRDAPELAPAAIDERLDVALVLGLGFDRDRFRLGHGRGYFDRFLAGRPLTTVGLAYDVQLVERLPVEPHDVAMTLVVSESETIRA
jgi:5-formyltetrahydrofolate cyclo-ligase